MEEFISSNSYAIIAITILLGFLVYLSSDKKLQGRFAALLQGKPQQNGGYEFDFIASPNIVVVNVTLTDVDGLMSAETVTQSADIIWKYSDMKKEVIERKVKPSVVDELLNSIVPETLEESEEESASLVTGPKVVKSHTVFIKRERNLDEGYEDYVDPKGDHTEIPDDWDFVESLDNPDQGVDADLTGLGEDQVL